MSFVGALALVGVACDDDDNGGSGSGGDAQRFCDLNDEITESGGDPSDEQLDELADLAPDEIRDDARAVIDNVKEEGVGNLPEELNDESDSVNTWIEENCEEPEDGNGDE